MNQNSVSEEQLKAFVNAVQLCIKSKINSVNFPTDEIPLLALEFKTIAPDDRKLASLTKLLGNSGYLRNRKLIVTDPRSATALTPLLMMSRLDEKNILALPKRFPGRREFARKLNLKPPAPEREMSSGSVSEISRYLFEIVAYRGFTLRQLAEKTGLTQATISNFKAGQDIRLSNFLKLAGTVGLDAVMKLKEGKRS